MNTTRQSIVTMQDAREVWNTISLYGPDELTPEKVAEREAFAHRAVYATDKHLRASTETFAAFYCIPVATGQRFAPRPLAPKGPIFTDPNVYA